MEPSWVLHPGCIIPHKKQPLAWIGPKVGIGSKRWSAQFHRCSPHRADILSQWNNGGRFILSALAWILSWSKPKDGQRVIPDETYLCFTFISQRYPTINMILIHVFFQHHKRWSKVPINLEVQNPATPWIILSKDWKRIDSTYIQ